MNRITDGNLERLGPVLTGEAAPAGLIVDDRYRIERRIARGGMGEIFRAADLRLDRPVALKVLTAELTDSESVRRFEAEAQTMSRIEHPGIVPVHDRGIFPDGRMYIAMKFVDGETLADRIERKAERNALVELLARACDVVQFAHERGVLHRDLKPTNVMVDAPGQVYVMDWGIARVRGDVRRATGKATKGGLTSSGEVLGTLEYMPPEQARGEIERLDARCDVFSLGAMLYEILTGLPPATGKNISELLAAADACRPVPPRERVPSIPRDLESICMKAMAREPAARYPSVAALAEDLRRFLRAEAIAARPFPTAGRMWRKAIRYRAVIFAVAATLTLTSGWSLAKYLRKSARVRAGIESAGRLERAGDLDRAREAYRAVLQIDESNRQARLAAERIDRELRRRVEEAEARERQALQLLETSRPALSRAQKCFRARDPSYAEIERHANEAQARLDEAVEKSPRLALARFLLGRCWEIKGREDRAEGCWRRALELDRDLAAARFRLGRLLLVRDYLESLAGGGDAKRREEARREIEAAMTAKSGFDDPLERHTATGLLAFLHHDWMGLVRIAFNGTQLYQDQDGTEDLTWLGAMALRGEERMRALDRAIEICPGFALARVSRGFEHLRGKGAAAAIADFGAALAVHPELLEAFFGRARAMELKPDAAAAIADYERVLQRAPIEWPGRAKAEEAIRRLRNN